MNWQQITAKLGREPRVGDWYSQCCVEDLYRIKDDQTLQSLKESTQAGNTDYGMQIWASRDAA